MAFNYITEILNCTVAGSTIPATIEQSGVLTIQPIGTATGTATVEVSNDRTVWIELDSATTHYRIMDPVTVDQCSWLYWRITVPGTGSGSLKFAMVCKT
jgi:hypothetical protein